MQYSTFVDALVSSPFAHSSQSHDCTTGTVKPHSHAVCHRNSLMFNCFNHITVFKVRTKIETLKRLYKRELKRDELGLTKYHHIHTFALRVLHENNYIKYVSQ